jgi:hypothetical protein
VKLYLHSPNTLQWRGAQLRHRNNFTFTFYIRVKEWNVLIDCITIKHSRNDLELKNRTMGRPRMTLR